MLTLKYLRIFKRCNQDISLQLPQTLYGSDKIKTDKLHVNEHLEATNDKPVITIQ